MYEHLSAELGATCAALGYYDGTTYRLEKDCVQTLKDLIRYLRRDDDSHTIRRYLGRTKLVQTDLIKIMIEHTDNEELFEVNLRLLTNLTSPALLLFDEELPTDKEKRNCYLQIVAHLQEYKLVFGDEQFWSKLCGKIETILNIPNAERPEDRGLVIERILILVRNALQVPADVENEKRTDSEGSIHDQVLFALHTSGMVDIFLFIASNRDEQQYQMHILEIVSLMLREQNPSQLAGSALRRSTAEKEKDEAELLSVRQRESLMKVEKTRKYAGSRHSRFGGTFVVRNMKAIGDNELICHKPFQNIEALEFGRQKVKVKRRKDKLGSGGENAERRSALSVRLFLKEFCVEFLNGAYNPVMRHARSCITGSNRAQANDESYYLWALKYFMEFNRNYKFHVKYVSETVSTEIFHLVQVQIEHYHEMMMTDKKKVALWSRRLHLGLKAYQELLHTLTAMDKCDDLGVRESGKVIKSNIFYVPEYRETILNQLLCYNETTMSRNYLTDVIETVHVFLKMLESFCGQGRGGTMIVQRIKSNRRRNKSGKKSRGKKSADRSGENIDAKWDRASSEIAVVLQSPDVPVIVPFDATLDAPIDEQKADAMRRVQTFLRDDRFEEAIGLLRAAREVWPENDNFGNSAMTNEEEFIAVKDIYFADLGNVFEVQENKNSENEREHDEDEEDEEEEDEERSVEETDFKFTDFLYRFVNVKVVKACSLLLKQFEKNTQQVNHSTVKLLHRIAVECKTPAMIFQASLFRVFQRILESNNPEHKELAKFAVFIVRKFAEVAEKNSKAYMELLFWKTTREATEMVEGYGLEAENKKTSRNLWKEEEEDELRALFMEHQTKKHSQDLVDWLLENMINDNRTRRGVIKKLKEMHLIVNSKSVRNEVAKRLPKEWSDEEISQLAEIWETVKGDNDPVELICAELRVKRAKSKVKEKLLELGLAKDRKELRKKRVVGKSSGNLEGGEGSSGSETNDDSDDSVARVSRTAKKRTNVVKKFKKRPNIVYTNAQLTGLVKELTSNEEDREALEWVKESLDDALEDWDEESTEGVPLVPITEQANAAMDSPSFQRFLRAVGIEPPVDEQETYWRIPSNMLATTIRNRAQLIADALEGKLIAEENLSADGVGGGIKLGDDDDDDGDDVFENVKRFFAPKIVDEAAEAVDESGEMSRKGIDSEPEEHDNEEVIGIGDEAVAAVDVGWSRANTSRVKASTSDSDSDEVENQLGAETIVQEESKRIRSDNSDPESPPALKKRRLIVSEDEDEEDVGVVHEPKQRKVLISEDDDDD